MAENSDLFELSMHLSMHTKVRQYKLHAEFQEFNSRTFIYLVLYFFPVNNISKIKHEGPF